MSELQLGGDHDDGKGPRFGCLLAVHEVRSHLERFAASLLHRQEPPVAIDTEHVVRSLRELIRALDRRVPRPERQSETMIARDAAVLRTQAVDRLAELTAIREEDRCPR
jgi:hypothetical protein